MSICYVAFAAYLLFTLAAYTVQIVRSIQDRNSQRQADRIENAIFWAVQHRGSATLDEIRKAVGMEISEAKVVHHIIELCRKNVIKPIAFLKWGIAIEGGVQ
jgi:hypothetical protein